MSETRHCAYCGQGKCDHGYKNGVMGLRSMRVENVSAESTAGEMQETFADYFAKMSPNKHGMWSIAFTELDPDKFAKAQAKRGEA